MTIHSNDFRERLARIEAGSTSNRHTLFVGMDEAYMIPPKPKARKQANLLENLGYAIGRVWAICLGGLAVMLLAVGRYWLGLTDPVPGDPINDQVVYGIVALCLAIYLGKRMYSDREGLIGLHATGVLLMTVGMHNVVHFAPEVFDIICSPQWTSEMRGRGEPYSIVIRGMSLSLF